MISRPDHHGAGRAALAWLVPALLAAVLLGQAPAAAAPGDSAGELILAARRDLDRADGIAAEVRLRQAQARGASRRAVAAYMGQALHFQEQRDAARRWLADGDFSPSSAAYGFRALARLERDEGNLPAAGRAYDRAIALTPRDATMWVEIGRLRYAGGEHVLAIEAADHAMALDPRNVRAIEFKGEIVRDRYGLEAALPWFEAALARAPDDLSVLGEYAATLGELGRAREMLVVTRRMIELDPGNPRAYYLQAVLAARAADYRLGRVLLGKTGGRLKDVPGAIMLEGVLELGADNPTLAVEAFDRLNKLRPHDARVRVLLARSLFLTGEYSYLIERFAAAAADPEESAYLQTLVARAYEESGRRDLAAPLLDLAARSRSSALRATGGGSAVAGLIEAGRIGEARARADGAAAADPGFYDNLSLAGDARLAAGDGEGAARFYARAAAIRMPENLLERRVRALLMAGRREEASQLADAYLHFSRTSRPAIRVVADMAAASGQWQRARSLYANLVDNGATRDPELLIGLANAQLALGEREAAQQTAGRAYRLQRSSAAAAQAWGLSLVALGPEELGDRSATAAALLAKARAVQGDSPALARGRMRLAAARES